MIGELNKILLTANANDITFSLGIDVLLRTAAMIFTGAFTHNFLNGTLINLALAGGLRFNGIISNVGAIRLPLLSKIAWRNFANTENHTIEFNGSDNFAIAVVGAPPYAFSNQFLNMLGKDIRTLGFLGENTLALPTTGFIRMANGSIVATRNTADSGDLGILFNASDRFAFLGTDEAFDSNIFTNHPPLALADPTADTLLIRDDTDGLIKEVLPNNLGLASGQIFAKVVKSVDEIVNNSDVFQDDNELFFIPIINKVYNIKIIVYLQSTTQADFKYSVSFPTGAVAERGTGSWSSTSARDTRPAQETLAPTIIDTEIKWLAIPYRLVMGSTAGNFSFQWAQANARMSDTKVLKGSLLLVLEQ